MAKKHAADAFSNFWKLCKKLSSESSYKSKTLIIRQYVEGKSDKSGYYYVLTIFILKN